MIKGKNKVVILFIVLLSVVILSSVYVQGIECYENLDCGEDECLGNFCGEDGNVHQHVKRWTCIFPGDVKSYCVYEIGEIFWNFCGENEICENGKCTAPACEDTCSSLGYECGLQNVCGEEVDCGSCEEGYKCDDDECVKKGKKNKSREIQIDFCGDGYCDKGIGENIYTCPEDCFVKNILNMEEEKLLWERDRLIVKEEKIKGVINSELLFFLFLLNLLLILLNIIVYFVRR